MASPAPTSPSTPQHHGLPQHAPLVRGGSFSLRTSRSSGSSPVRNLQKPVLRVRSPIRQVQVGKIQHASSFNSSQAASERLPNALSSALPSAIPSARLEQSPPDSRQQPPQTALQVELKDLRRALESKYAHLQNRQMSGGSLRVNPGLGGGSLRVSPGVEHEQCIAQQVEQVQQMVSGALEKEVKDLCATVACQQAEQAVFLTVLKDEMGVLRQQLHSRETENSDAHPELTTATRELEDIGQFQLLQERAIKSLHSELDVVTSGLAALKQELQVTQNLLAAEKSAINAALQHLKLEVDARISQQQAQLDSSQAGEEWGKRIEDLHINHELLQKKIESDLESLRHTLGEEVRATSTMEDQFADFQKCFSQSQKEAQLSSTLLQGDVSSLRDMLTRSFSQEGKLFSEESSEIIRSIKAEVDQLRLKHADIEASLSNRDPPLQSQTQSELRELRSVIEEHLAQQDETASMAQQTAMQELDVMRQQLKDQAAQIDAVALGSVSTAAVEARQTEALAMQKNFEQQLQEHAQLVTSLNDQVAELRKFAKQSFPSVQKQPSTQRAGGVAGQEGELTAIKSELEALKLQLAMQRSLRTAEVAKEAGALHGRLHKVVGSERDARMQDSAEMRELIKKLYDEMADISQQLKAERDSTYNSDLSVKSVTSAIETPRHWGGSENGKATEPIAALEVQKFFKLGQPGNSAALPGDDAAAR